MTTLLVTNDDGVTSPALIPLIEALGALPNVVRVNTLVPDRERSWISKSLSRFEDIVIAQRLAQDGEPEIMTASGTPADCANLGIHRVFEHRPTLVVSGVNLGLNHGLAFLMSSGTVGAASEGVVAGLPAIAFSVGVQGGHGTFVEHALSEAGAEVWRRCAAVAADIVSSVLAHGLPSDVDLLNVNFPPDVGPDTPRVVTEVARVGYDGLFSSSDGARYIFNYEGLKERAPSEAPTDLAVLREGMVSITPLRLPHAAPIHSALSEALVGGSSERPRSIEPDGR